MFSQLPDGSAFTDICGKTGEKQPASEEPLSQTFQSNRSVNKTAEFLGQEARQSAEVQ